MSVGLYQKRAVTVEAVQWTGDNLEEIVEFAGDEVYWYLDTEHPWLYEGDFIVRDSTGNIEIHPPEKFLATHVKVVGD
jgi:hypothetical protein